MPIGTCSSGSSERSSGQFRWLCHAYCLMTNHYHLLVETPDANISEGMRQLNGLYTQRFNRRHEHVGHVFQGRFKGILVERESHLLELARYVVLNPVRAEMVRAPEDYRWSSLRADPRAGSAADMAHGRRAAGVIRVARAIR